jgi:hypothetical protein
MNKYGATVKLYWLGTTHVFRENLSQYHFIHKRPNTAFGFDVNSSKGLAVVLVHCYRNTFVSIRRSRWCAVLQLARRSIVVTKDGINTYNVSSIRWLSRARFRRLLVLLLPESVARTWVMRSRSWPTTKSWMNFTAHDRLSLVLSAVILPILKRYACKTPFVKANRCQYNTMSITRYVLLSVLLADKAVIAVSISSW